MPNKNFKARDHVFIWDDKEGRMKAQKLTYGWYLGQIEKPAAKNRYKVVGPYIDQIAAHVIKSGPMKAEILIEDFLSPPEPEQPETLAEKVMPEVIEAEETMKSFDYSVTVGMIENMILNGEIDDKKIKEIAKEQGLNVGRRKGEKLAVFVMDNLKK